MPARSPEINDRLASQLHQLGARIRAHRKLQKLSATVVAEAAGLSRVTMHRIERGEPSVTMGAYLSALGSVGLQLDLVDPPAPRTALPTTRLPARLRLGDYPQLKQLAWQRHDAAHLSPAEALSLYERHWRHLDPAGLQPAERALIQALADELGGGRLLV